jgi:hypothetical protein
VSASYLGTIGRRSGPHPLFENSLPAFHLLSAYIVEGSNYMAQRHEDTPRKPKQQFGLILKEVRDNTMNEFYRYLSENMAALGLPAPHSLFSTAKQTKETIGAIAGAIRAFGAKATLGEIVGTIPSLSAAGDLFTLGSAISASFYIGACIVSLAVASSRSLLGGRQIADFLEVGHLTTNDKHLVHRSFHEYVRAGGRLV